MIPRDSRVCDLKGLSRVSRQPDAKWIDLGQADEVSEMVVLTNAHWLRMDSRHTCSLPESQSFWADVFVAWVSTELTKITQGEELIKKGPFGNVLVRQSLARASPDGEEESAKINHEREKHRSTLSMRVNNG